VRACLWLGIMTLTPRPTSTSYPTHIDVGVRPERVAIAPVGPEGFFHRRVGEYIYWRCTFNANSTCSLAHADKGSRSTALTHTFVRAARPDAKYLNVGPSQAGYA